MKYSIIQNAVDQIIISIPANGVILEITIESLQLDQ